MTVFIKIFYESLVQAFQQLTGNKLRSFLSLLGISIGIFCIIAVWSAVDSLESSIKNGFSELGSDVVYLDNVPWNTDNDDDFYKYIKRPEPSLEDFEAIQKKVKSASLSAFSVFVNGKTIKYRSSSVNGTFIMGPTFDYAELQGVEFEKGRYFTRNEYTRGANTVILGHKISEELFGDIEPVGKTVKLWGQSFKVVGVIKEEGESMFDVLPLDEVTWISFNTAKKFINIREKFSVGKMLCVQAKSGVELDQLKDDITGVIRSHRRLRPYQESNFALNELSMLSQILDSVFGIMNMVGLLIGGFSLVVGMISVANIMFVSVKERTNIIGVKKALGAKRYMILLEFLIEAIVLCIVGGIMGMIFVWLVLTVVSSLIPFQMFLSMDNVIWGVGLSVMVGMLAGLIPAMQASKMDPVEAIRQG